MDTHFREDDAMRVYGPQLVINFEHSYTHELLGGRAAPSWFVQKEISFKVRSRGSDIS